MYVTDQPFVPAVLPEQGNIPPRLSIDVATERDLEIVKSVHKMRLATREQIQRLHFPCRIPGHYFRCNCLARKSCVNRRLSELKRGGILQRFSLGGMTWGQGRAYVLNWDYERAWIRTENEEHYRSKVKNLHRSRRKLIAMMDENLHTQHRLLVNDIYIWFRLSAAKAAAHLTDAPGIGYSIHRRLRDCDVQPDGIFTFNHEGMSFKTYIEADNGTMRPWQLREKFESYEANLMYRGSAALVLVVTSGSNCKRVLSAAASRGIAKQIWCTTSEQLYNANALTEDVWQASGATTHTIDYCLSEYFRHGRLIA